MDTIQKIRDEWTHTVSESHGKAYNQLERINKLHVEVFIYTKAQNRKKVRCCFLFWHALFLQFCYRLFSSFPALLIAYDQLEAQARQKYEDAMFDFTEAANEFIRLLDKGYLEWFDLARQAQLTFYAKATESMNFSYSQPVSMVCCF